ncbi:MAG: hypothetical protein IJX88_02170 [Clostridia bacterium]|nr:hypothetical protein [Clostridia bacterium]
MTRFDEYVTKLSAARAQERMRRLNDELVRRVKGRTKEETLTALFAALRFPIGSSDILPTDVQTEKSASLLEFV